MDFKFHLKNIGALTGVSDWLCDLGGAVILNILLNYNGIYVEILSSSCQETFLSGCSEILQKLIVFALEKCPGRSVRVCWVVFNVWAYQIIKSDRFHMGVLVLSLSLCISWFLVLGYLCATGVKLLALKMI